MRGRLWALSARAPNDIWAVGGRAERISLYKGSAYALRWNGRAWRRTPSPRVSTASAFEDVVSLAPTDAWAVGHDGPNLLIAHWDGARWTRVQADRTTGVLTGVAARARNDVWAVGSPRTAEAVDYDWRGPSLVLHWNGSRWLTIPPPDVGSIWGIAVAGRTAFVSGTAGVARWTGVTWVTLPEPEPLQAIAHSLFARSPNDLWIAGGPVMSWNGQWTVRRSEISLERSYSAVAVTARGHVWAVGQTGGRHDEFETLAELWDGRRWRPVPVIGRSESTELIDVVSPASGTAWALEVSLSDKSTILRYRCS
jgi:hypothetical protein